MWLLNTTTFELEVFEGERVPKYAILSHRWEEHEASFEDAKAGCLDLAAFPKVVSCCKQALSDGLLYVWIDTCCIDKRSSAELSEAINSMYEWYKRAAICYAYLFDVDPAQHDITNSRWFTRGWTLQELLAPAKVRFYDSSWTFRGTKSDHAKKILNRWRIPVAALLSFHPHQWSIAERMSWASYRETTRVEDCAYCLLGLFDVNMPLLYGEGQKAFQRLQESLMAVSNDLSIFAYSNNPDPSFSMLAEFPSSFLGSYNVKRSAELSNEIPDHIGFDEKPYSFIQQDSQYVMTKEGMEAVLQLHHYMFNVYCFRLGSIRFLRTKGIGMKFQLPRLDLYAFLEYEPSSNRYRRVALDGATCVAKAVNRVLRTRTVRCMIAKEPLQEFCTVDFDRSQLARVLHRRELRGFAFISQGRISEGGMCNTSNPNRGPGLVCNTRDDSDPCPYAYDGCCLGFWYDPKVSVLSVQPALILHFGYDFEEHPVILLSVPGEKCHWEQASKRESRILGSDHVCCADGCASGLKRGLPAFLLSLLLQRIWPHENKYTDREEWQAIKASKQYQDMPTITIEGIGEIYQYKSEPLKDDYDQQQEQQQSQTQSQLQLQSRGSHHAIFEFSKHINGIEMLPCEWIALKQRKRRQDSHSSHSSNGMFHRLHQPPRTQVRRRAALLIVILLIVAVIVVTFSIQLISRILERLGQVEPIASLLVFLFVVVKVYRPIPTAMSLHLLELRVIEVIWDLALY